MNCIQDKSADEENDQCTQSKGELTKDQGAHRLSMNQGLE